MVKVFINNNIVFVPKNTSALEACELIGVIVPRFCYHERLNVAGNCRMCLVEIEKAPKPIASCAFPVAPNMRIYTNTPLVQKARENVLEFLLMNHPLDCAICDQAGECDLQEQTLVFGADRSRFLFSKRGVEDKNCGLLVKTIMTRCIHCTRCVRFFQDVAGQEDFGTTLRGQNTEIGTYIDKNLASELSGNVIDLCPVGALTSKPYAFTARPWEIKATETIDVIDSVGSNIKINFKETEILRILPVLNDSLNEEWISDKTRFFFDSLKTQRIGQPFFVQKFHSLKSKTVSKISWRKSLEIFWKSFQKYYENNPKNVLFVCGNNADLETLAFLKTLSQKLNISLIGEEFRNANNDLMPSVKSNVIFSDVLNSDLCLTVGTNVRFEASLLNIRLKKRIKKGNFIKVSIGLNESCTYANDSIGNSIKTLFTIAEGKHSFCQKLVNSKKPFIILGSSVKKRLDSSSITNLLTELSKYCRILDENWFGINFLPITANEVGAFFVGVNTKNNINLTEKNFIYCVGLDSYTKLVTKVSVNSFIVAQTAYADPLLKRVNLILPSTSFAEKEGTFVNLEGRFQKTANALIGPSLARDDLKIIKTLFGCQFFERLKILKSLRPLLNEIDSNFFFDIEQNKSSFTKKLFLNVGSSKKVYKTSFKPILSNFFSSNILTQNSLLLSKCASMFKKNYSNFI